MSAAVVVVVVVVVIVDGLQQIQHLQHVEAVGLDVVVVHRTGTELRKSWPGPLHLHVHTFRRDTMTSYGSINTLGSLRFHNDIHDDR